MRSSTEQSAEAGAKKFAGSESRKFNYYQPKSRRATLYEDVTVDVQPDPKRYLLQDWIISFADGRPAYSEKNTKIKSSDWHLFRDPNGEWERTHYIRQADIEKQVSLTIQNARAENAFESLDKTWIKILQDHLGASKHPEYGLGMLFQSAQRDGMSQMINTAILINSSDKLRYAQDIALYMMEMAQDVKELNEQAGKENWLNNPLWQGAREAVENFYATTDWAEQVFAANLVYEPLVGELFRSGFLMQFAASHGDYVTPTVVSTAEADLERNLSYSLDLFSVFLKDPQYGDHNKEVAQGWLKKWTPMCVNAAKQLQPIWSQPRKKVTTFAASYTRAQEKFNSIWEYLQLDLPEEVKL
ncbi:aromatic/alkene monooxygenase hydroxylase subunit beta [Paenibacillus hamazuiensis]|uniref:aromatic/alkene monooxygenase hydroxylase subunit beta n=1 Tax=Paenibacillus hamazuiensis TaxID=2936508 RepID=UPI00200BB520|nr:aromatic/alkene monooxygenase hydroxylase subunit beta [Paenibacillus hamazuiensis]